MSLKEIEEQGEWRDMLWEMLNAVVGWTDKEVAILESLDAWPDSFSLKQGTLIESLYRRRM